jgi:precorrin-3B synthase
MNDLAQNSSAREPTQRRGACPGLSAPMPTGDGLLVRLQPTATIPLVAFAGLCAAARAHGNGIVEITARGSVQVRGLSEASAPRFAAEVIALGIAAADGVPIHCNPLAGLDAEEIFDAGELARELRRALAQQSFAAGLSPKVSVAIDGGGQLGMAELSADIRLDVQAMDDEVVFGVSAGGNAAGAAYLGAVAPAQGVATVLRLLDAIAQRGRSARARDIVATEGVTVFRAAIADLLLFACDRGEPVWNSCRQDRERRGPIGMHPLRDGSLACGVALAFGHADAVPLERLSDAARSAGASGVRAAPGRALLILGLSLEACSRFIAAAEQLGFIVRPEDLRRRVIACAGAPVCASAYIAARAMAPRIAETLASFGDCSSTVHISGCAKGCAHAAPAALTIVGTSEGCALIAGGSAQDAFFGIVPVREITAAIARFAREARHV